MAKTYFQKAQQQQQKYVSVCLLISLSIAIYETKTWPILTVGKQKKGVYEGTLCYSFTHVLYEVF